MPPPTSRSSATGCCSKTASLSQVSIQGKLLNNGLLGYVLPGSQMRFALPPSGSFAAGKLQAMVNDNKQPVTIPSY